MAPWLAALLPMVPSLLNFGGQTFNSAQASQTAKYNTDATIKAQKEAAELAYKRDMEQWNRSNAYNNPAAQMQRMRAAGLNPMMAYGSGNVAGMSSGASPQMSVPNLQYNYQAKQLGNLGEVGLGGLQVYQDLELKSAQTDNVRAGTAATQQATRNAVIQESLLRIEELFKTREKTADLTKSEAEAFYAFRKKMLETLMNEVTIASQQQSVSQSKQLFPSQLSAARGALTEQQQRITETRERIRGYPLARALSAAQTAATEATTGKTKQDTLNAEQQNAILLLETAIKSNEVKLSDWNRFMREELGYDTHMSIQQVVLQKSTQVIQRFSSWLMKQGKKSFYGSDSFNNLNK